jgi:general secretion pathway protein G
MKMTARGFTLVEMLLVLALAGIILAIAIPAVEQYIAKSRRVQSILDIAEMSAKIKQSERTTGVLAEALADVGYGGKLDPWGQPYEYVNLRTAPASIKARKDKLLKPLNSDFDLYSIGRDGLTKPSLNHAWSRDDIVRARDGGFIGTGEEFDP